MHQFSVGEIVTWIPEVLLRSEAHGDYRIVAAMPDRDGDHVYRIKSSLEEYERVVKENLLVKSQGSFPKDVLKQGSCRISITLPTLAGVRAAGNASGTDVRSIARPPPRTVRATFPRHVATSSSSAVRSNNTPE